MNRQIEVNEDIYMEAEFEQGPLDGKVLLRKLRQTKDAWAIVHGPRWPMIVRCEQESEDERTRAEVLRYMDGLGFDHIYFYSYEKGHYVYSHDEDIDGLIPFGSMAYGSPLSGEELPPKKKPWQIFKKDES